MAKKRKQTQLVKKEDTASLSNVLNEMVTNKMTLQQLRFFLVYLSKINPKNPEQTEVSFTLKEYSEALGVELNEASMNKVTDELLTKIVHIRPKVIAAEYVEAIIKTQLFRRCIMARRKSDNAWIFTFDASEDVKPHLFDLKSEYTSFEIWNTLNLGNVQDARMYMLLRQYRIIGERTIELKELKRMLGIDADAYPEYKVFARDVLKKCQKALKKNTDICFDFNAVGRPAKSVHFEIYENKDYKLPKFLDENKELDGQQAIPGVIDSILAPEDDPNSADYAPLFDDVDVLSPDPAPVSNDMSIPSDPRALKFKNPHLAWLAAVCDYEFSETNMKVLYDSMIQLGIYSDNGQLDYLRTKYNYMNFRATKKDIPSRFGYLKGAIINDWG